jgi:predicted nucleic acid-binding protein
VAGAGIFDLQLVATMLANGVRRIYTFNRSDFEVFEELMVLAP